MSIGLLNVEMLVWLHLSNWTQQTQKIKWLKLEIISKVPFRNISYINYADSCPNRDGLVRILDLFHSGCFLKS